MANVLEEIALAPLNLHIPEAFLTRDFARQVGLMTLRLTQFKGSSSEET